MRCALGLALVLAAAPSLAQTATAPAGAALAGAPPASSAPAPSAPITSACFPVCREGFTCHQGRCVSLCNPPCPESTSCVEGRRCEPSPAPARRVYEPPAPAVKAFDERSHTLLAFHLGLPGALEQDGRELSSNTTLGFNLRGDAPIAKYVLLGPMLQLGAWSADVQPDVGNNYAIDLDLVLRLRLPIATARFNYQAWVGMPVGLTIDVLGDSVENIAPYGLGWNIGVLFGGAVHFSPKLGLFAEAGWQQHKITHTAEVGPDLDFALRNWCSNFGLVIRN